MILSEHLLFKINTNFKILHRCLLDNLPIVPPYHVLSVVDVCLDVGGVEEPGAQLPDVEVVGVHDKDERLRGTKEIL